MLNLKVYFINYFPLYMCVYIYMYTHIHIHTHIYIYMSSNELKGVGDGWPFSVGTWQLCPPHSLSLLYHRS